MRHHPLPLADVPRLSAALLAAGWLGIASTALAQSSSLPELAALSAPGEAASVVGVSSGGYMAMQMAVAWPTRFSGVGVMSAGPWGCAQGSLATALNRCMMVRGGAPSLDELNERRTYFQAQGWIGDSADFATLRAYVWHGEQDGVIAPRLGELLGEQLSQWLADEEQLKHLRHPQAGHGWPVHGVQDASATGMIQVPTAGSSDETPASSSAMLDWLYPERGLLADSADGQLIRFDQSAFDARGLADEGYLYQPAACQNGGCPVTVALHGCRMSAEQIGDVFVRHTGLNDWADRHGQLILYPQTETSMGNPQGCWDWWGFAESSWQLRPRHESREGTQVSALMAMLGRLETDPETQAATR